MPGHHEAATVRKKGRWYNSETNTDDPRAGRQPPDSRSVASSALDLDNQEQAAFAGLAEFLRHIAAGRKQVVTKDRQVIVRLAYGI